MLCIYSLVTHIIESNNYLDYAYNSLRSQAVNVTNCLSLKSHTKTPKMPACFCRNITDCGLWLAVFEPLFKGQSTIKCGGSGRRDRQTDMHWLFMLQGDWSLYVKYGGRLAKTWWLLKGLVLCISPHRRKEKSTLWDLRLASADGGIILSFADSFFHLFIYLLSIEERQKKVKLEL